MSEYIFDAIDSDKKRRYIYVEYIDKASRNFFITLQHIYKCVKGVYSTVTDDDFGKDDNTVFIFDNLTRAEEQERVKMLLNKHFPFLRVIEDDFNESDKITIIKKCWDFLKSLRNAAEHDVNVTNANFANNKTDIMRWLRTDFGSGKDVKKRGIAIAAKKEMKDRFFLLRDPKSVFYFMNNCNPENGNFAFRSLVIFVSLFLEGKYTYQFITTSELKSNFFYKERNRQGETNLSDFKKEDFLNLYRALSIYNINLPADKYDAQYDKINNLGLYIINELQKCPHELFEHISLKDQNKFRVQGSDNADYPEDILLKRFQDRFATLVLRYIDTQKLFKDIRFQVSLGKYRFKFYEGRCIDSDSVDSVHILQKELKSFGRLDDMEEKRRNEWADVLRLTDLENQAVADTAATEPYITGQITRYNIDKQTPKIPLWWDGDCPLPITKDQVKQGQKVDALKPKAFLPVYDLPAMMFLHFLGGNPEKLIKEYYNSYIQLFTDIRDGILTPDNYSESEFVQKYKIKLCDVPKELQNYLLRKKTTMPERFQGVPSRVVKKSLLEDFKTNTLAVINKKIEKVLSEPQNLKSGKMADYLAKSIVNLLKDNKIKPTGKNFSVMQANLAVYESFDKINQMLTRSKIADNHPFLKKVLDCSPRKTLDFYKFYLNEEKTFFSSNDNFSYLKVYKYRTTKYDEKGATYYKSLANHYISNGFVELTNHIFADVIRAKLSGKIADIDAADTKYNIAFLISRYYKESQPFYSFNREYKISQLNKNDEPKGKVDYFKREQKHNEKAINRYRVQDKILFEMAKTLLSASELKLSDVMHKNNVFETQLLKWKIGKFRKITFKNYQSIDDFTIDCGDYQWTVLLGNNNSGKTSLLRGIVRGLYESEYNDVVNDNTLKAWNPLKIQLPYNDSTFLYEFADNNIANPLFAYGVSRYPSGTEISGNKSYSSGDCDSLFSPHNKLLNIEEWLIRLDYNALKNSAEKDKYEKIKHLICSELFPEISVIECESGKDLKPYVLYHTPDGKFRYEQLGFGYQSMLSWVVDLGKRLFEKYPTSENPFKESAVVLVDEIDLHLHPEWQRKVIATVSRVFPNIQFIVTTHSPLVIQSMENVNLYVLRREGDKIVTEHPSITNFSGWTVEEILRDLMKLDDNIRSDVYQKKYKDFTESLNQNDKKRAKAAYETLIQILHPESASRSILEMQLELLLEND